MPDDLTPEELDAMGPEPGDTGFSEPVCWGLNSYEHYRGECKHFNDEYHLEAARDW